MIIGILKTKGSPLVAITPDVAKKYIKDGHEIIIEPGAGESAFFNDDDYKNEQVRLEKPDVLIKSCDILLTDDNITIADLKKTQKDTLVIGRFNPLVNTALVQSLASEDRMVFSLDMVPRTSIAQSMDILSSLASLAGYKAVIMAAERYPGYFPMMSTAAGTVPPAKILILGAGVAGLQAIATARRLGAVVEVFDVRSAVKEEVQSLGAKFIEVEGSQEDKDAGGYAVQQSEEYIRLQKELIHERSTKADVVITTANIPGKKAPLLLEKKTVELMKTGSIIIDMASSSGGNCELSEDQKEIKHQGVTIIGNSKLYETSAREASRLYSTNLYNFVKFLVKEENLPVEHEIVQKTLISKAKSA